MAAQILDGKLMSGSLRKEIAERVAALKEKGVTPGLAVILVGNDPASEIYVRNKGNGCAETGMYSRTLQMPAETTQEQLEEAIEELNADRAIHGILVQLPLPGHLDEQAVRKVLNRVYGDRKDSRRTLPLLHLKKGGHSRDDEQSSSEKKQ